MSISISPPVPPTAPETRFPRRRRWIGPLFIASKTLIPFYTPSDPILDSIFGRFLVQFRTVFGTKSLPTLTPERLRQQSRLRTCFPKLFCIHPSKPTPQKLAKTNEFLTILLKLPLPIVFRTPPSSHQKINKKTTKNRSEIKQKSVRNRFKNLYRFKVGTPFDF